MKAAVDRSKKKETNDPSLDLLYKIPVHKMFWSLHLYHVLQGLTPQWCVRQTRSLPPQRSHSFVFFLPALKYFKINLNVGEIHEYNLIAKKEIDKLIKFY